MSYDLGVIFWFMDPFLCPPAISRKPLEQADVRRLGLFLSGWLPCLSAFVSLGLSHLIFKIWGLGLVTKFPSALIAVSLALSCHLVLWPCQSLNDNHTEQWLRLTECLELRYEFYIHTLIEFSQSHVEVVNNVISWISYYSVQLLIQKCPKQ